MVKEAFDTLGSDGGYVFTPAASFQADVPPENMLRVFEAAIELGTYN